MLYGRRSTLSLKGAVYESYVKPTILYGREAWCLKENFMKDRERSTARAIHGLQHSDRKKSKDLILMFSLNKAIDQLAMANTVHWYGHVLRREDVEERVHSKQQLRWVPTFILHITIMEQEIKSMTWKG